MSHAVLQPGVGDENICEKLAESTLDDDVKVSVVISEAPPKLVDTWLVNSHRG